MEKQEIDQLTLDFDVDLPENDAETVAEEVKKDIPEPLYFPEPGAKFKNDSCIEKPSVDAILRMLDKGSYKAGRHAFLSDIFECGAIAISNQFDHTRSKEREERYLQIINNYDPYMRQLIVDIFHKIFKLLSQQINPSIGFSDYLGELYMKSETSNSKAGQFFTPYNLSKSCAKMSINSDMVERYKSENKIITINEPACGAGGMIIAAADILYNEFDFNYSHNMMVYCSDIDARCVHMTYLQLSLAGIPAIITRQNTLTMEKWDQWETPAYIMQYLRFRDCLGGDKK